MPLISAQKLSKSFGAEDIFSELTLSIPRGAKIGLVGPNGSGKSTLLQILMGIIPSDSGTVQRAKKITIGYLPQNFEAEFEKSPYQECLSVFSDLILMKSKLNQMEQDLTNGNNVSELLSSYGNLQNTFESRGGYVFETRIHQVLQGLGFSKSEENRPWYQLSGGQKTRAYLAKILLMNPDLLILDEPTNHLDINAIEWLESFLKEYKGGTLIVSHDRYFLNQTVEVIWELDSSFEIYHGNYDAYLQQRQARYERQKAQFESQQEFIAKEEEYIRRNIEGQNTRQAQGRRTRLERLLEESKITNPILHRKIQTNLSSSIRSGDIVLRTKNLEIGYLDDHKKLISIPDVVLQRGECVAILGPNGVGKSTFIKTILNEIPPLAGEVEMGANLKVGYFAQAHEKLNPKATLMDEISAAAPQMLPAEIRSYLARFLFTGDDVFKTTETLSGGERGRLALAILALQNANLLLLDEPMNHLDLEAQETLQALLKDFNGTILLISHDRYLVDAIATQIWEVNPDKKTLEIFRGNYSEYKEYQKKSGIGDLKDQTDSTESKSPEIKENPPLQKLSNNEIFRRQKKKEELEKRISVLEKMLNEISQQMVSQKEDHQKIAELGIRYNSIEIELNSVMEEWAEID
ncbi:MAG TPA: ABC-F family ATP-binding cassette domain-containing protein [Flexilinea sp.]|nr:ABC-F family ATP-binding cassette domain-containing protein [Flexilinea sp.]HOW06490.1 ABC-F family ATP-binding cassette domain-containing protein [Flexilinea sp.]